MRLQTWLASISLIALAACAAPAAQAPPQHTASAAASFATVDTPPSARRAFFGDLHLHTTNSFDAYVLMGTKTTPEEAYAFARGETIQYLGQPIRRGEPLDFLAVTDHSENIGVFNELDDRNSALSKSALGQRIHQAQTSGALNLSADPRSGGDALALLASLLRPHTLDGVTDAHALSASAWQRAINAANHYYEPGRFTTFVAYEWSSMPGGQNLHRNVIFRDSPADAPFSSFDSQDPQDLWSYLVRVRAQGHEALAIAHNANASNGLMYDWTTLNGRPLDQAYAVLRNENEPLSEISQNKGTSETHPALSPNDEFANFEIFDRLLISPQRSKPEGSYLRDALGRGLALQQRIGVNPYHDGFVGASDFHSGLSVSSEADYAGSVGQANLGGGRPTREQAQQILTPNPGGQGFNALITGSGALTGVWANANTRDGIYSALRRRETFATSGPRISVRLFAGWSLPADLVAHQDWVARAYALGTPMGNDLPAQHGARTSPQFVLWAQKDPNGANLDRAQIVKVWVDANGGQHEHIYDVGFEPSRARDAATGKLAPVGDTVNVQAATYQNTIGSVGFLKLWRDPDFDPATPAAYYVRVLEIPTPRWTTILAAHSGVALPSGTPAEIQERAWSSPIWYTPSN